MAREFAFERDKFKQFVLYMVEGSGDDRWFGSVNLAKKLWAAEFLAYLNQRKPITGAEYRHRNFGPAANEYKPIEAELVEEGKLAFKERRHPGGRVAKVPVALASADLSDFNECERWACDFVLEKFTGIPAKHIVDWSHSAPAWLLTEDGEPIPYFSALLGFQKTEVTAADQKWAEDKLAAITKS